MYDRLVDDPRSAPRTPLGLSASFQQRTLSRVPKSVNTPPVNRRRDGAGLFFFGLEQ